MANDATHAFNEEEAREAKRHDALYAEEVSAGIRVMQPDAWEKFDSTSDPNSGYFEAMRWLGDVRGRRVLDIGCGTGWLSIILAKRGASLVEGFDISAEAVRGAELAAEKNGVSDRCRFRVGSVYSIPWETGSFDLATGHAILHHVRDKQRAAAELDRVMAPGGRAVFHECLGNSIVAERLRWLVPVWTQSDEKDHWKDKIKYSDLDAFRERFSVRFQEFELLYSFSRVMPSAGPTLRKLDGALLSWIKPLRRYARDIVIELVKAQ